MEANLKNLKEALRRCAQGHDAKMCDWSENDQLAIDKANVPILSDVRTICEAFFGSCSPMDEDCGYTVVWLDMPFLKEEVNVPQLNLALPKKLAMVA